MKRRKENGKVYLSFAYNMEFANKLKNYCAARWSSGTKEWVFDEEFEDKSNDLILKEYGFNFRSNETITVEIKAWDFYESQYGVRINGVDFAWRSRRDADVTLKNGVVITHGEFPEKGGSAKYPSLDIAEEDGIVLRIAMHKEFYDTLSENDKMKITVVSETTKKEQLLARKEQLLKELETLEAEIAELE